MLRRRFTIITCFGLLCLGLAGCGSAEESSGSSAAAGKPASEHTLRLGYYEDIQSPDPDVQYDIPGMMLVNNTYEGLVHYAYGDSVKIEPWLATSWKASDKDSTYTFQLRKGVLFHDGTPLNSAAIKFDFERRIKRNRAPTTRWRRSRASKRPARTPLWCTSTTRSLPSWTTWPLRMA